MTYPLLAIAVLIIPVLLDFFLKTQVFSVRQNWLTLCILLVFTLVFDVILTGLPIVTYNVSSLLGVYIGSIPIEDFSYTFAMVFIPIILMTFYEQR